MEMSSEKQKKTFEALVLIDTLLKKHSIIHWLDVGTLLCAYRDGDLSNEHDADIGIFGEDYKKVQSLEPELREIGFITEIPLWPESNLHHFKIYENEETHLIDLIPWYKLNNEIRSFIGVRLPWCLNVKYFEKFDELSFEKISTYKFPVPYDIEKYIEACFGKNWKIPMTNEQYTNFQKECIENISIRPEANKPYHNHKKFWLVWQSEHGWLRDISSVTSGLPYEPIKLHLGSGSIILDDFINCDLCHPGADVKCDAKKLPFPDNFADEIYSSHLIEHFDFNEGLQALKEWYRVLKPGGKLVVECPDFEAFCRNFLKLREEDRPKYYVQVWGYPWEPGQAHKFGYTPTQMSWSLKSTGFKNINKVPALRFVDLINWCMKFECEK